MTRESVLPSSFLCLWLHRREPRSGRFGREPFRLEVVVGSPTLPEIYDQALALEIREVVGILWPQSGRRAPRGDSELGI